MRYTISEMASLLGVTTHTLRYYRKKMGLSTPRSTRIPATVIIQSLIPGGSTCAGNCGRQSSRWKNAGS